MPQGLIPAPPHAGASISHPMCVLPRKQDQIPPELPCSTAGPHSSLDSSDLGTFSLPIKPAPSLRGGSKDGEALSNIRIKFQGADKKNFMILIELGLSGQKRLCLRAFYIPWKQIPTPDHNSSPFQWAQLPGNKDAPK